MNKSIYSMLQKVAVQKTRPERIEFLRQLANQVPVIPPLLKYTFDGDIRWLIPAGVPYRPNVFPDQEANFPREVRNIYLFIEGGHPTISQLKREQMFLRMMESIGAEDAQVLLAMKDRRLPFPEIDAELVNEAFPGLLNSLAKPGVVFDPTGTASKEPDNSVAAYEADFLKDEPIIIPKKTAAVPITDVMAKILGQQEQPAQTDALLEMERELASFNSGIEGIAVPETHELITTTPMANTNVTIGQLADEVVTTSIVKLDKLENSFVVEKKPTAVEEIMSKLADPETPQHLRESLERILGRMTLDKKPSNKVKSSSKKKPTKAKPKAKTAAKARSAKSLERKVKE